MNKCLNCAGYCDDDFCCEECEREYDEAESEFEEDEEEEGSFPGKVENM